MPKKAKLKIPRRGQRKPPIERDLVSVSEKGERILHANHTRKTLRVIEKNRRRGFVTRLPIRDTINPVSKIEILVKYLQKNGVFCPKIISIDRQNNIIEFEKKGVSLQQKINALQATDGKLSFQSGKVLTDLLAKHARLIAKVHSLKFCQGHPKPANVIVRGNRMGFIDFMFSELKDNIFFWDSTKEILDLFGPDYEWIQETFKELNLAFPKSKRFLQREKNKFFTRVLRRYGCSIEAKQQIAKQLEQWHEVKIGLIGKK
jgi:hypothetical protein